MAALWAEPEALPFPNASLDLVVLPHTLELSVDPHMALREVERVLVPEGRVVIAGYAVGNDRIDCSVKSRKRIV